jgi:hypothetical protein
MDLNGAVDHWMVSGCGSCRDFEESNIKFGKLCLKGKDNYCPKLKSPYLSLSVVFWNATSFSSPTVLQHTLSYKFANSSSQHTQLELKVLAGYVPICPAWFELHQSI